MPLRPATASASRSTAAARRRARGRRAGSPRARAAVTRSRRERPEPSTIRDAGERNTRRGEVASTTARAGAGRALPAQLGAERLQHELGRVVVAVAVHEAKQVGEPRRMHLGEREAVSRCRAPGRLRRATSMPAPRRMLDERGSGGDRGSRAPSAVPAAVDRERRERRRLVHVELGSQPGAVRRMSKSDSSASTSPAIRRIPWARSCGASIRSWRRCSVGSPPPFRTTRPPDVEPLRGPRRAPVCGSGSEARARTSAA